MVSQRSLYEPELDGLRLVAFLAVFFHHLPSPWASGILKYFHTHGWSGVELFFVISSFLLFRLLDAEYQKNGRIDILSFYIRRMLRIYPLMVVFSVSMMVLFFGASKYSLFRLAGILTFTDNIIAAFTTYNIAIMYTSHLWTLGFEFQFYCVLPFIFLAWKRFGSKIFLLGLGIFYVLCVATRAIMTASGVQHPVVWVIPLFQPDALLLGIVLATGATTRIPRLAWPVACAAALALFLMNRPPWTGPVQSIFSYILIALASGALVQSVRTIPLLGKLFRYRPVVYLGTISFGLYVFHILFIGLAGHALYWLTGSRDATDLRTYLIFAGMALGGTVVASVVSYHCLERPFLRLKDRFSLVFGRAPASV